MGVNMKKFFLAFLFLKHLIIYSQVANHIVIAEIYGDGGNSGAVYKYDYIVLYNPTQSDVNITGWSLQYSSATSYNYSNNLLTLNGTIKSNSYYLIQLYSGGDRGNSLPTTPNITGNINLSGTAGKIALVSNSEAITNKSDVDVVDFVGYGSTANEYEGSNYAVYPSSSAKSLCRKDNNGNETYGINGNGWDSDDNRNDFFSNSIPSPLPVELISFTAIPFGNKVQLNWSTATEVNNYGFELLRFNKSPHANNQWQKVAFIPGNGNSNSLKFYSYVDEPSNGYEFVYKLKQIDYDGTFEYSYEIPVKLELPNDVKLHQNFPNPFNPITKVRYSIPDNNSHSSRKVIIKVFDILGKEIITLVNDFYYPGNYEVEFDGSNLSAGVYYIVLITENQKFINKCLLIK